MKKLLAFSLTACTMDAETETLMDEVAEGLLDAALESDDVTETDMNEPPVEVCFDRRFV